MQKAKKYQTKRTIKRMYKRSYRVPRNSFQSDLMSLKAEYFTNITTVNGASTLQFTIGPATYVNYLSVLTNSTSFQSYVNLYQKYKITGVTVRLNYCVGLTDMSSTVGFAPNIAVAPYTAISTNYGGLASTNDHKMVLEAGTTLPKQKYWKYSPNFVAGNGVGLGEWNDMSAYSGQTGQVSCAMIPARNAGAAVTVCSVQIILYVVLGDKTG